jgi:hypothetical protein
VAVEFLGQILGEFVSGRGRTEGGEPLGFGGLTRADRGRPPQEQAHGSMTWRAIGQQRRPDPWRVGGTGAVSKNG